LRCGQNCFDMKGLFLGLISTFVLLGQAQSIVPVAPDYEGIEMLRSGSTFLQTVKIKGADYDPAFGFMPVIYFKSSVGSSTTDLSLSLSNIRTSSLSGEELAAVNASFYRLNEEFLLKGGLGTDNGITLATVSILPLRINPSTKVVEKLISADLVITPLITAVPRASSNFQSSSALGTGTWFKIPITQDGIYRIDRNYLQNLGINVGSLDPRTIRIHGNGKGMLPENNSVPRNDDLVENRIFVSGEADGVFNTGDYVLFYAKGPHEWQYFPQIGHWKHIYNVYSDTAYYFLSFGQGQGLRVSNISEPAQQENIIVNHFDDYAFHERDLTNIVGSGRQWFGEYFDITNSYNFTFPFANLDNQTPVWVEARAVARSFTSTSFSVSSNGSPFIYLPCSAVSNNSAANYVSENTVSGNFSNTSPSSVILNVSYVNNGNPSSFGWLDFLTVNVRRNLTMAGGQITFRSKDAYNSGGVARYNVANCSNCIVWDVTDPTQAGAVQNLGTGNIFSFKSVSDALREFVVFNGSSFLTPPAAVSVPNQNLHAWTAKDLIIITPPSLLNEANRLAAHHTAKGARVGVATTTQVYNEFSSGAQDVTAIRELVRMLYKRFNSPSDQPQSLLLFGDASYDYKDRVANNSNRVPTWQSPESFSLYSSYCADDYFGFLDDNEGDNMNTNYLNVGIGRFVVNTLAEAAGVVDKLIAYDGTRSFGDWRTRALWIADDADLSWETIFVDQSEMLSLDVDTTYPQINSSKVYLDSYQQQTTPNGQIIPQARQDITDNISNLGVLFVNYIGHGGELGLASEQVVQISDIQSWDNSNKLSTFITVTCEFSRFDDPNRVSAGEYCQLNPNGAAVALFSTTRVVYVSPAADLNRKIFDHFLELEDNEPITLGQIMMRAKNNTIGTDRRKFTLLGDPGMKLSQPAIAVRPLTLNGKDLLTDTDTLKAGRKVVFTGDILDDNGVKMSNFNGFLIPTVFDKWTTLSTNDNDGIGVTQEFELQNSILYKGKVSVVNGEWSFEFIVPLDIAYNYGFGKLSLYAYNNEIDGWGQNRNFYVGGSSGDAILDDRGPEIKLYMNDESFVYGGITDENPIFLALLSDESGINTTGNAIGHDLVAVLDGSTDKPIVLNEYYEADLDSYKSGRVSYPFYNLSTGLHSITFKAWDVFNNSSTAEIQFVVAGSADIALNHVLNYPNPFTTYTEFHFEHNRPNEPLYAQIQIFTVSGKLVKTISGQINSGGYRVTDFTWNGLDDFGSEIGKGTYVYRVMIKSMVDNSTAEKYEKLVLLR
jgi:hypothetical protein